MSNGKGGKSVITLGFDDSSSVHADNNKKVIFALAEGPTDGLEDTTITGETKYSIIIVKSKKKICLSLHYNGSNSILYANGVKMYQFKSKD